MKHYDIPYAEDVPHYGAVLIEAETPEDAIRIVRAYDYEPVVLEPEWPNAVSKRIVNIQDADGTIIAEDIALDETFLCYDGEAGRRRYAASQALCEAAGAAIRNALDWDGQSEYVDVRKADLDALQAAVRKAEGRAGR